MTGCQLIGAFVNQRVYGTGREARSRRAGLAGGVLVFGWWDRESLVKVECSAVGNQHANLIMHQHLRRRCESAPRGQRPSDKWRVGGTIKGEFRSLRLVLASDGAEHAQGIAIHRIGGVVASLWCRAEAVPKRRSGADQDQCAAVVFGDGHTSRVNAAVNHQTIRREGCVKLPIAVISQCVGIICDHSCQQSPNRACWQVARDASLVICAISCGSSSLRRDR